jgi:DNA processing protein
MHDELLYLIALSRIHGLGPIKAKSLITHLGSARAVFREKPHHLYRIPDIGKATVSALSSADIKRAEKEVDYILKEGIRVASWSDEHYPERLRQCDDGPLLLFARGNFEWNPSKAISIVGTRKADSYGKDFCHKLIEQLTVFKPTIISGLAHGIDAAAHIAAIECKLPTLGCVAHGLDKIYPPIHRPLAARMELNGGIITEFPSETIISPEMFPMRNRIIAGLADCTIVVQTDVKGGSVITAHIAQSYGREVFAVPGRIGDTYSNGCHKLIRNNIAAILTSAEDLVSYLHWDQPAVARQTTLDFSKHCDPHAADILGAIQDKPNSSFDDLLLATKMDWGELNAALLQLEFEGLVIGMPGKRYRLKR